MPSTPAPQAATSIGPERFLAMGVVVVAMVVAVIVGQVMLDGPGMPGRVEIGV